MSLDELRAEIERLIEIKKLAKNQCSHKKDLPPRRQRRWLSGKRIRVTEVPYDPFYVGDLATLKPWEAVGYKNVNGVSHKITWANVLWTGKPPKPYPYGVVYGREWTIETNRRLPSTGAYNEDNDRVRRQGD